MKARDFLNLLEHDEIVTAIRQAEQKTSGEIRVVISHKKLAEPVATAQEAFVRLGMTQTKHENAVLIFVSPLSKTFAIIGDKAVHAQCGEAFWREVTMEMTTYFRKGEFSQALLHGITKAGKLLAQYFPHKPNDRNELPNQIIRD